MLTMSNKEGDEPLYVKEDRDTPVYIYKLGSSVKRVRSMGRESNFSRKTFLLEASITKAP